MSATLFTAGKFRAFYPTGIDGSAAPLAGGFLYAYAAGTTTAKDTYTDQSGTVPNSNPVVLDANGEANVWLTGNYKFVLKDPAGIQLWSEDDISDTIFSTAFSATSTTSLGISTGSRTFVIQSGKAFAPGQFLLAASNANPNNYMSGNVISYSGTTLVLNIVTTGGSGTFADWNISLSGTPGPVGPAGPVGSGSGNVNGPSSANDGYIVLYDGTTGKLIKQGTGGPGTAAYKDAGSSANQVALLDGSGNLPAVGGGALTGLNGSAISSGIVPANHLGSGTPTSSTVLLGDNSWGNAPTNTAWGTVGTYGFLLTTGGGVTPGTTRSGSTLQWSGTGLASGSNPSGTWQGMGTCNNSQATLWVRIA